MHDPSPRRERVVQRLMSALERKGQPRLLMFTILAVTGLAGFFASVLLHAAGMTSMWARYPVAVGIAYLVFLILLGLWLASHRHRRTAPGADPAAPDYGPWWWWWWYSDPGPVSTSAPSPAPAPPAPAASTGGGGSSSGSGRGGLSDLNGGDAVLLLVLVLIVVALVTAALAAIYALAAAPILLAEVLADGLVMAGIGHRLRHGPSAHWAVGVVRRTWLPVVALALMFGLVGYGLEQLVPGATTMGEAVRMARDQPAGHNARR
jgi:hypothetical protein